VHGMENASPNSILVSIWDPSATETSWQESPSSSEMDALVEVREESLVEVRVWTAQVDPWRGALSGRGREVSSSVDPV